MDLFETIRKRRPVRAFAPRAVMQYRRLVRPGTVAGEMVLDIDMAPALLDLTGVPVPEST